MFQHHQVSACTFFFSSSLCSHCSLFGSVLQRPASARTHMRMRPCMEEKKKKKGERAVTERKRSAISACGLHGSQSHSKLPSGFACMVLVSTTLFIGTFRLRRITASNRVCALRADAYFSFSHAVSYHQKQRELGINIIVRTVKTGSLRGLNLICW